MNDTNFVREVARQLACDEGRAEALTYIVLHELRDRLTPKEAADVAAQLPGGLRRQWQEGEQGDRRIERIHLPEFLGRIRSRGVLPDDTEAERAARAVFSVLQRLLGSATGTEGEAWDIFSQLPKDLKRLWLSAAAHLPKP